MTGGPLAHFVLQMEKYNCTSTLAADMHIRCSKFRLMLHNQIDWVGSYYPQVIAVSLLHTCAFWSSVIPLSQLCIGKNSEQLL